MTPTLIHRYVRSIVLPSDPLWEVRRNSYVGTVQVHFFGVVSDKTRRDLTAWLLAWVPVSFTCEVTDEGCQVHEDCRTTPELGRTCWVDTRVKGLAT